MAEDNLEYDIEELLILVKELTDIYTGKESTSITYEAAQSLMGAVLYCIRENERSLDIHEGAETAVSHVGKFATAGEAYDRGYRLVTEKVKRANEIYSEIIREFKDYGNRAYYDTVVEGMPEFFRWYEPRLRPADHILLLDYPVLEQLHHLEGVDLIYPYLKCIRLEQKFLSRFPEDYVREVLIHYHSDYEELLINLCAIIVKKVLANMLIGDKLEKIIYEEADYQKLGSIVSNKGKEDLLAGLRQLLEKLINNVYKGDPDLYRYLADELVNIATELKNAAENNSLRNIL